MTEKPVAVITGASSGIGEAFAHQLASEGFQLLLVARNLEKLQKLAEKLKSQYVVSVDIVSVDLADTEQTKQLAARIETITNLEYMVNNAGFGLEKRFPDVEIEKEISMIRVHCEATVRLSQAAILAMRPRKKGFIINVASVAAFLYGPGAAEYCGTKSFLNTFSLCLQADVNVHGICVQSLCPGYVRTGFHAAPTMAGYDTSKIINSLWLKSDRVVRDSLRAIRRKYYRPVTYVPSFRYKFLCCLCRLPLVFPMIKRFFGDHLDR